MLLSVVRARPDQTDSHACPLLAIHIELISNRDTHRDSETPPLDFRSGSGATVSSQASELEFADQTFVTILFASWIESEGTDEELT